MSKMRKINNEADNKINSLRTKNIIKSFTGASIVGIGFTWGLKLIFDSLYERGRVDCMEDVMYELYKDYDEDKTQNN